VSDKPNEQGVAVRGASAANLWQSGTCCSELKVFEKMLGRGACFALLLLIARLLFVWPLQTFGTQ
jgi:hypothetical protein